LDARRGADARPSRAGLDAYVLNARDSELGTGVGPALRQELLLAAQFRQSEAAAKAAAAKAAAAKDAPPRKAA
jgi:hypothetical protein